MLITKKRPSLLRVLIFILIAAGLLQAARFILRPNPKSDSTLVFVQTTTDPETPPQIENALSLQDFYANKVVATSFLLKKNNTEAAATNINEILPNPTVVSGDFALYGEFKYDPTDNTITTVAYPAPTIITADEAEASTPAERYKNPTPTNPSLSSNQEIQASLQSPNSTRLVHAVAPSQSNNDNNPAVFKASEDGTNTLTLTDDCYDYLGESHIISLFEKTPLLAPATTQPGQPLLTSGKATFNQLSNNPLESLTQVNQHHARNYQRFFGPNDPNSSSNNDPSGKGSNNGANGNPPPGSNQNPQNSPQQNQGGNQNNNPDKQPDYDPNAMLALLSLQPSNGSVPLYFSSDYIEYPTPQKNGFVMYLNTDNNFPEQPAMQPQAQSPEQQRNNPSEQSSQQKKPTTYRSPTFTLTPETEREMREQAEAHNKQQLDKILAGMPSAKTTMYQKSNGNLAARIDFPNGAFGEISVGGNRQPSVLDRANMMHRRNAILKIVSYLSFIELADCTEEWQAREFSNHIKKIDGRNPDYAQNMQELLEKYEALKKNPQEIQRLMNKLDCYQYPGFLDLIRSFPQEYSCQIAALEDQLNGARNHVFENVKGFERKPYYRMGWYDHRDVYPFRDFIRAEANRLRNEEEAFLQSLIDKLKKGPLAQQQARAAASETAKGPQNSDDNDPYDPDDDKDNNEDHHHGYQPPQVITKEQVVLDDLKEILTTAIQNNQDTDSAMQGLEWIESAEAANLAGNKSEFDRYYNRAAAALETIIDNRATGKTYSLSDALQSYAQSTGIPLTSLQQLTGTPMQHALHKEALNNLNSSTNLLTECQDAFYLNNSLTTVNSLSAIALEHVKDHNLMHAGQLLDLTHALCDTVIKNGQPFAEMTRDVAQFICEVGARTGGVLKERIPGIIANIPHNILIGKGINFASSFLPGFTMTKIILGSSILAAQAGMYAYQYYQLQKKDPIQAHANFSADLIQLLATGGITSIAARHNGLYNNHIGAICGAVTSENAVITHAAAIGKLLPTQAVASGQLQALASTQPGHIATMLKHSTGYIKKAYQFDGKDPGRARRMLRSMRAHEAQLKRDIAKEIQNRTKQPIGAKSLENAVEKVRKHINPVSTYFKAYKIDKDMNFPENIPHFFELMQGYGKNKLVGYHSIVEKVYERVSIKKPPNRFGVYEAVHTFNKEQKPSTMYPDDWCKKMIFKANRQAKKIENRVHIENDGFIGQTKDGLFIQFWLVQDSKTKAIIMNSAYPYVEESLEQILINKAEEMLCKKP